MPRALVTLTNEQGLHARPAAAFSMAASTYGCDVTVEKAGRVVNGKSVISLMALDCRSGDEIAIGTEGVGAAAALAELVALVGAGLGEHAEAAS